MGRSALLLRIGIAVIGIVVSIQISAAGTTVVRKNSSHVQLMGSLRYVPEIVA